MKLKGTIVAVILNFILIKGMPFRIGNQSFNFFNYFGADIFRILNGFFGDIEYCLKRIQYLRKSLSKV
jgi:hypothetical protein